ncbi:MAG: exosortase/archaeosortase family protein [Deltaproteobacteria bacterium]|nr:exosortase/archaeosortase family protein [Deltaproteobacteria bacterium]
MVSLRLSGRLSEESLFFRLGGLLFCIGLVGAVLYSATLSELSGTLLSREGSSHGLFVPLLSVYFAWQKRSRLRETEEGYGLGRGLMVVAGGLILFLFAWRADWFTGRCLSFLIVLSGLVILFFGWRMFRELSFSFFFLIFMIPVPESAYVPLADWIRGVTVAASTVLLPVLGVPFLREDWLIHLPGTVLQVNIGCSGVQYLLSYFVFGVAYAYLYRERLGQRLLVVCAAVPISLAASTLRLTAITALAYYVGPRMAEHRPHIVISWLVFVSVLVLFVGLDRLVGRDRG